MKKNSNLKSLLTWFIIIAIIVAGCYLILGRTGQKDVQYSDIVAMFRDKQVESFTVDGSSNRIEIVKTDKTKITYQLRDLSLFYSDCHEYIEAAHKDGILKDYDYPAPKTVPWWVSMLPMLIIIIMMVVLTVYILNKSRGGRANSFGRAKAKLGSDEKNKVRFADVAGVDEEKEELEEVVDFLKQPAKYTKLGARIPHGVLLVGPPGTGKTMLAKAVAGEAGVPFYSISGSDFVELYVGVGASRVRDLFDTARKTTSSVIFIDEIDAVGRHRGAGLGGGHDEREQTLNQLLVEMDGFGAHDGIIVMAATNRPDILDPALLRPGRFDRQITVGYPDLRGREAILRVHARNKPLGDDVDLKKVAQTTVGMTGAELANLLNEAALLAARTNKEMIGMDDIEAAALKVTVGPQKKNAKLNEHDKKNTAYHEAGHAIIGHFLPSQPPVRLISIIPSGNALGFTLNPPEEDRFSVYRSALKEEITTLLGGRVAEELIFGDYSAGASNDIQRATALARNMVTRYGMSEELGPIVYGSEHSSDEVFLGRDLNTSKNFSEKTAALIDEVVKNLIEESYAQAKQILTDHRDKLDFVADFLLAHETMDADEFKAAMDGKSMEEVEQLGIERQKKIEEENERRKKEQEEKRAAEQAQPLNDPDFNPFTEAFHPDDRK